MCVLFYVGTSTYSSSDDSFDSFKLSHLLAMFISNFTHESIGALLSCYIDHLITHNSSKFLKILLISIIFKV